MILLRLKARKPKILQQSINQNLYSVPSRSLLRSPHDPG